MKQGTLHRTSPSEWVAATAAALLLLSGCHSGGDEEQVPNPPSVQFQGKPDPSLVGDWSSSDGRSELDMKADGKVQIVTVMPSPSGPQKSSISGDWRANGKDLLLQYADHGQGQTTVRYSFALTGNSLKLTSPRGTVKTVYTRK